jgi:hypothetical protein
MVGSAGAFHEEAQPRFEHAPGEAGIEDRAKSLKTNNPRNWRNESEAKSLKTNNPTKSLIRSP